jgi:hypothetical protein
MIDAFRPKTLRLDDGTWVPRCEHSVPVGIRDTVRNAIASWRSVCHHPILPMPSSTSSWSDWLSLNIVERWIAPLRADRPLLLSFLVFLAVNGIRVPARFVARLGRSVRIFRSPGGSGGTRSTLSASFRMLMLSPANAERGSGLRGTVSIWTLRHSRRWTIITLR